MMENKTRMIGFIIVAATALICLVSLGFSYHVYSESKKKAAEYDDRIRALHRSTAQLEKRIADLTEKQERMGDPYGDVGFDGSLDPKPPAGIRSTLETERSGTEDRKTVKQLARIIRSTGLDQLAAEGDVDPTLLTRMVEDYELQEKVSSYRERMLEQNRNLHQADRNDYSAYAEELMSLYQRARLRRRGGGNTADQEEAFNEMLAKFPEAYVTGLAIGERALRAAIRRQDDEVEEYYRMLRDNETFSSLVTDRGTEVMPHLERYMAYNYIRQGRMDEAQVLIESLENNYSNSYIITRGANLRVRWVPVQRIVDNLRNLSR